MKKLFFVLAIGAFAACNNSSSTEAAAKTDSMKVDSNATKVDTMAKKVDSMATKVDSMKKDTTKAK
jgi:outer membrane murein-binding lipoprotein Lpp